MFGISLGEIAFEKRGFRGGEGGMRDHIERIGRTFREGYHTALDDGGPELSPKLDQVEVEFRGFSYEGAAMGLALLDHLTPWRRNRVQCFLRGAGEPHTYMVHVAIGWVMARLPGSIEKTLTALDPLLRWLVLDGYGFHEGFFNWPRYLRGQPIPKRVTRIGSGAGVPTATPGVSPAKDAGQMNDPRGQAPRQAGETPAPLCYAARAFDQGLGRSLWFVDGGDVARVRQTIAEFPEHRQADLWSGIGLASVYAGAVNETALNRLRGASGAFGPQLAQGAAFAAKARCRAGNPTAYTERACRALCGLSAVDAATVTDAALENLAASEIEPAFEVWRRRIQERFIQGKELKR